MQGGFVWPGGLVVPRAFTPERSPEHVMSDQAFPDPEVTFAAIDDLGWLALEVIWRHPPEPRRVSARPAESGWWDALVDGPVYGEHDDIVWADAPTVAEAAYLVYRDVCVRVGKVPQL
jgi:hypothetical protein